MSRLFELFRVVTRLNPGYDAFFGPFWAFTNDYTWKQGEFERFNLVTMILSVNKSIWNFF